jgi:hypothetical protein
MLVVLLTFFWASLPRKPMRVTLLSYIRFSCSVRSASSTRKRAGVAPKAWGCFSGGTETGEPEPEQCRRQSRSFADAGRRKSPEAVPRQRVEKETDRKQSRHGRSQPPNMQREIVVALPTGLESVPYLRAAAAQHHAKT